MLYFFIAHVRVSYASSYPDFTIYNSSSVNAILIFYLCIKIFHSIGSILVRFQINFISGSFVTGFHFHNLKKIPLFKYVVPKVAVWFGSLSNYNSSKINQPNRSQVVVYNIVAEFVEAFQILRKANQNFKRYQ